MGCTTDFGKQVKKRLIDLGQTQTWLIGLVREKTGLYFDSAYMYKILHGKASHPKIESVIRQILELEE